MVVGTLGLLFYLEPRVTLLILPFMVALGVAMHLFRRAVKGSSLGVRTKLGDLATLTTETLSGIGVVKAFVMERAESTRFTGLSMGILGAQLRLARLEGIYGASVELILVGSTMLVIWLVAPRVIEGEMTVGALVAYLAYLASFYSPLKGLSRANFQVHKALGAAQRIFAVLDTPSESDEVLGDIPQSQVRGHLKFEHVTFGYRPDQPVLKDLCLEVHPGEVVALVGTSGAGKTTIMNLLLKFYRYTGGDILMDGYSLDRISTHSLRRK